MSKAFCWFTKITGWLPYVLINRPKYYYEDKKVQSRKIRGKAIVMPNHHSVWDFGTMLFAFPSRNLHCLVAELIYDKGKVMHFFMKALGSIRVERNDLDFTFLDEANKVLQKKGVIEFYPEARLAAEGEEKPLPFKTSLAYLALLSGAPVIPVVTNGGIWKGKRMRVLIGKPIDVQPLCEKDKDERENIQLITDKLREKIIELNNELEKRTKAEKEKKKK